MTAGEQLRAGRKLRRIPQLIAGLIGYGTSVTFLVESGLGASSWSVLAEGVSERTGLSFGWATNLIAVAVLLFWVPLRELPGLGTLLNVLLVGLSADLAAWLLPVPESLGTRLAFFAFGLLMLTFSDAVYLGARFGSGPRDGLMTGAVRVTGRPIWLVRTTIEIAVLAVGWALGGTAGLGTLVVALAMGPLVQQFLRVTTVRLPGDHLDKPAKPG
ncbi:hypothetical protein A4R43_19650 [Amycolatopsis albispora]|uniref:Membrane protein YczE n=2 Tax=Amycolatopsis albispora TaxID=1804986 RepID=A0A344L8T1_9PSEU|nr:hypothetical protein A4R43_19650 [Amycolatopsis albispora]